MGIRSRPQQQNERQIIALIEKGGTVATKEPEGKQRLLQLRPPEEIVTRIDKILTRTSKHLRPSRHAWIIQAILEKLEKDE